MKTQQSIQHILIFVYLLCFSQVMFGTHNRSGEIRYRRIAPFTSYTYSITVVKYFDDGLFVADRCVDSVYFGDGSSGIANRVNGTAGSCCGNLPCGVIIVNDANYQVKMSEYSVIHTYAGPGTYRIYSTDQFRVNGISNFANSDTKLFYIEALMFVSSVLGPNNSPLMTRAPIDRGFVNTPFTHNACAIDEDGDSLSYELIACRDLNQTVATGFTFPAAVAGGTMSIHPITGLLTWNSPAQQGKFQVALLIREWRRLGCWVYQQIGYVERDFEIIIGPNNAVSVFNPTTASDACVAALLSLSKTITAVNQTPTTPLVEIYGNNRASINPASISATSQSSGTVLTTTISYPSNCTQVRAAAQHVYVVYTFSNLPVPQTFYTQFKVKVIPPPPQTVSVQAGTSSVTVQWQPPASCNTGIRDYRIYRRLGVNTVTATNCDAGAPVGSGFVIVGSVSGTNTTFTDYNLWTIPNGTPAQYLVSAVWDDCTEGYGAFSENINLIVGLKEHQQGQRLNVLNPIHNVINVQLKDQRPEDLQIQVLTLEGKLCNLRILNKENNTLELDASTLSKGVYVLRMINAGIEYHYRLVKVAE